MNEQQFLEKLTGVWGDRFAFVPGTYQGAHLKLAVHCNLHDVDFTPLPTNLLSGHGCRQCGKDSLRRVRKGIRAVVTQSEFETRAKAIHGTRYDYQHAVYVSAKVKMRISCRQCGETFEQNYSNHVLAAKGCPTCKYKAHAVRAAVMGAVGGRVTGDRTRTTLAEAVRRARLVHGDSYTYLRMESRAGRNYLAAQCAKHGEFTQAYWDHVNTKAPQGCPNCSIQHSRGELALRAFISRLVGRQVSNDRALLGGRRELDIFVPEHKLAVEYCGEYFHSSLSPSATESNTHRHKVKHDACAAKGIRLLTLWESEWQNRQHAVKQLVRTAVGKQRATIYARKCEVIQIDTPIARQFFDRYHVQGGAGGGINYALRYGKHIVAVMRFAHGQNDRGAAAQNRGWTLGRYATRCSVPGGASRLFKAFLREHSPESVKSFSDERLFAGGMYAQLGFALEATLPPDYQVWSPKQGLRPKSHYQRRALPLRLQEHGLDPHSFDPATDMRPESEMVKLMNCGQLYDCGKKRWVWTRQ